MLCPTQSHILPPPDGGDTWPFNMQPTPPRSMNFGLTQHEEGLLAYPSIGIHHDDAHFAAISKLAQPRAVQ